MKNFSDSFRLGFFVAVRQVRRTNRWMTFLTIFIMALTFLNLIATTGLLVGIVAGAQKAFKEQWTGDLFLGTLDNKSTIERTKEILDSFATFPEISSYSARLIVSGGVEANWTEKYKDSEANRVGASVAGIDPYREKETTHLDTHVVEGEWLKPGDTNGIVLGSGLLQSYSRVADLVTLLKDIHPGSKVKLTVTHKKSAPRTLGPEGTILSKDDLSSSSVTQEFTVRGIVDSKVQFVATRAYILDTELRKMLGSSDFDASEIALTLKEGVDPYIVKSPLVRNGFSSYSRINTAEEGAPEFLVNIKLFFGIIGAILGSISIVVALITIFIIIYINALTRRRQIGILKGIGVSPLALELSYIFQAVFYVAIGSFIALFLVFVFIKPYLFAHPIDTPFATIVLVADPIDVFTKWLLTLFVSIFAGYIPARLIIKQNTLNAILGRN